MYLLLLLLLQYYYYIITLVDSRLDWDQLWANMDAETDAAPNYLQRVSQLLILA